MTESNSWNLPWLHFHISRAIKCLWCAQALTQLAKSSRWWGGSRGAIFWNYKIIWFSRKIQQNCVTSASPDSPVSSICCIYTRWILLKQQKKILVRNSSLTGASQKRLAVVGWLLSSKRLKLQPNNRTLGDTKVVGNGKQIVESRWLIGLPIVPIAAVPSVVAYRLTASAGLSDPPGRAPPPPNIEPNAHLLVLLSKSQRAFYDPHHLTIKSLYLIYIRFSQIWIQFQFEFEFLTSRGRNLFFISHKNGIRWN